MRAGRGHRRSECFCGHSRPSTDDGGRSLATVPTMTTCRLLPLLLIISPAVCLVTGASNVNDASSPTTATVGGRLKLVGERKLLGNRGEKESIGYYLERGAHTAASLPSTVAAATMTLGMRRRSNVPRLEGGGGGVGSMMARGGSDEPGKTMGASQSLSRRHRRGSRLVREMVAEFAGTFLIVHLGCGTVCSAVYHTAQVGLWQVAAVWSLAVTIAITCTAGISGAHLNPAVSLAMAMFRGGGGKGDDVGSDGEGFGWGKVLPYWTAQLSGAVAGGLLNLALFGESIASFERAHDIVRGTVESVTSAKAFGQYWSVSSWQKAFFAEIAGTALLSFVIFSLTNPSNESTGAVPPGAVPALIGGTVGCLISVLAPLTQAGFNPARDLGPRLVTALAGWGPGIAMKGWWVYALAPLVGAPLGAYLAERVLWGEIAM